MYLLTVLPQRVWAQPSKHRGHKTSIPIPFRHPCTTFFQLSQKKLEDMYAFPYKFSFVFLETIIRIRFIEFKFIGVKTVKGSSLKYLQKGKLILEILMHMYYQKMYFDIKRIQIGEDSEVIQASSLFFDMGTTSTQVTPC